jgi:hypothetical protein
VTCGLNDMLRVNCASLDDTWLLLSLKNYGPLTLRFIPVGFFDCSAGPDVQLEQFCVRFKELSQFILWCEDFTKLAMLDKTFAGEVMRLKMSSLILTWPMCRKVDVWQMVVPYWIMKNELMVPLSPVVSYTLVAVYDECVNSEHLQTSSRCETSLTSPYEECQQSVRSSFRDAL